MGELLKKYGKIDINGMELDVELNGPSNEERGGIVHIQNSNMRMEMSQRDFYDLVGAINLAKDNLERMKGIREI